MDIAKPTLDKDVIIKQQADALAKLEQNIVERDEIIANLREQNAKQADVIKMKRLDNFDLQADIDRLRHQLEAIKNIIAL